MDVATAEPGGTASLETALLNDRLIAALKQAIGDQNVQVDEDERRFFSQDVLRSGALPMAVVQPRSVEDVQRCAALCHAARAPMIPRGGGLSYTDGYLYPKDDAVLFDLRALNHIVQIAADDMYVTVEAGCTWDALDRALEPLGLRTHYWGPVSGLQATVGGALSQNSVFWGAVRHGVAAGNVLGLDIVLADGGLLGVGAHGGQPGTPAFFRAYGPELTGLFTGDCGALGLKVRATLPLIRRSPRKTAISFAFDAPEAMLDALGEVSRRQLIAEVSMFDSGQQRARVSRAKLPLRQRVQAFFDVARSEGPLAALQMARRGQRFLEPVNYSLHLLLEAPSPAELKRHKAEIGDIMAREGGWSIAPTLGQVLSARPFPPPGPMIASSRFLPMHGVVPHSLAKATYLRVLDLFDRHRPEMERLGVRPGIFSIAVGAAAILIEPTCHWDAPFLDAHPRLFGVSPDELPKPAENPDAEQLAVKIREEICELFLEVGASHLQIGRQYPFKRSRNAANWSLLSQIKALVDPNRLMNPGVLGFDA
jgi:FAD/FMN-containing dehydrogenase